jgi:Trypsin-like peptidase domain
VVGIHKDRDLALLKIDAPGWIFEGVSMEASATVRPGMPCYAIGTPTGSRLGTTTTHSITKGIISAVDVKLPGGPFIQTTTPVNPGNSGGPLCGADGKVLGVVTARLEGADSIAFAIPWEGIRRADFKDPEPVAGPSFQELELRAREAARLAAAETGERRAARLREELDARRAQLAFAEPPPGLLDRLTELWIEVGDTAAAARMVDLADALDPGRALTGFWRGQVMWAEGRRAAALDVWLETVGRHDPPKETSRAGVARCLAGCGVVLRGQGRLPASLEAFRWAAAVDPGVRGINGWPADFDKLVVEVAGDEPLAAEGGRFSLDRLRRLMRRTPSTERADRFSGAPDVDESAGDPPPDVQRPRKIPTGLPAGATKILLQSPPIGVSLDPDGRHLEVLPAHARNSRVLILFEIDGETHYRTLRIPAP